MCLLIKVLYYSAESSNVGPIDALSNDFLLAFVKGIFSPMNGGVLAINCQRAKRGEPALGKTARRAGL